MKKEVFFSELKNDHPNDEEIERIKKIIELFDFENVEELTKLYLKTDVTFLADIFENFVEVSINEFDIVPLNSVSIPAYAWF